MEAAARDEQLDAVIEALAVPRVAATFLTHRWRSAILWMEPRARRARLAHYTLRLVTVTCGVILPVLVAHGAAGGVDGAAKGTWLAVPGWVPSLVSLVIALSAALDQILKPGEHWRHYRRVIETLRREGWLFAELAGAYAPFARHEDAVRAFVDRVEDVLSEDVESYFKRLPPGAEERPDANAAKNPAGGATPAA